MNEIYILIAIFAGLLVSLLLIRKWINESFEKQKTSDELIAWLKSTNTRIDEQNKNISTTLQSSTRAINERLDNAARYISAVQKNIGEMSEIGRGMKELQEFLQSPKLRGNIGERILKEILSQMLPKQLFFLQYTFKSGVKVDAAIKTTNGIIPVDSKFPMENFRKIMSSDTEAEKKMYKKDFERDVRKHALDITQKYILTEEGTMDYALMYLPSESIYYEVVNNPDLFDYCSENRVLPVSPMTFYAYLRAILMSFEGQKIENQAKEILKTIHALQKDYSKVEENMSVLNKHLTNAYNQMSQVLSGFLVLGQKISATKNLEAKNEASSRADPPPPVGGWRRSRGICCK